MEGQQDGIPNVVNALTVTITEAQFRFLSRLFWERPCEAEDVQIISELQRIFSPRNATLFGTPLPTSRASENPQTEETAAPQS